MRKKQREAAIRSEFSVIEGRIQREGVLLFLRCRFWESGSFPVVSNVRFNHPSPAFNRVFLFHNGGCNVECPNGVFRLGPNRIHLLPISQSFSVEYRGNSVFDFFHIKVEDSFGRDIFDGLNGIHSLDANAASLFDEIVECYPGSTSTQVLRWQTAMFQAVCRFCENHWALVQSRIQKTGPVHEVLSFVQDNLHPTLSVDRLASHSGMSRPTLNRFFQKHVGTSAKEYVLSMLIQQAKETLAGSDGTVKEASATLGYEDPFYFQRLFKQRTGLTPLQFREQALTRPGPVQPAQKAKE